MVRSKICGITRPEDALHAIQYGVDALGLVFYAPSPRSVTIEQAQKICRDLPPFVSVVALFVNAEREYVNKVCESVPVSLLQFHGEETRRDCEGYPRPYIKAIRVRNAECFSKAELEFASAQGILADTYKPGVQGGTGESFDWSLLPNQRMKPLILAGGLNASNVRTAMTEVNPFAVDVSGGVEKSKGVKSPVLIEQFLREVSRGNGS
jgi:phosphoribosylanthranilate isomerase